MSPERARPGAWTARAATAAGVAALAALLTPALFLPSAAMAAPLPPSPARLAPVAGRSIPLADSAGSPVTQLYSRALALVSSSRRDAPLQAAIAVAQGRLDADAVNARLDGERAASARARAVTAEAARAAAASRLSSLTSTLRSSALSLYMGAPPVAGVVAAGAPTAEVGWALGILDATLSPAGILAQRGAALGVAQQQAAAAVAAAGQAAAESRRAQSALAAEGRVAARLRAQLVALDRADAAAVLAARTTLAAQAGRELRHPSSLQVGSPTLPAPLSTTATALAWAFAELGVPYLWGGTGNGGFDCSGLMQYVWSKAGVSIPRVAAAQYAWSDPVSLAELQPGDLVFFGRTDIHHVGIYIGGGLMINAPHTGTVVQVSSIWWSDLAGFGRVHAAGTPTASRALPTPSMPAPRQVVASRPVPSETAPPPGWKPRPRRGSPPTTAARGRGTPTTTTGAAVDPGQGAPGTTASSATASPATAAPGTTAASTSVPAAGGASTAGGAPGTPPPATGAPAAPASATPTAGTTPTQTTAVTPATEATAATGP